MQSNDSMRTLARTQNASVDLQEKFHNTPVPELIRFICKGFSYLAFGLFVVADGLSNPESYDSKFLTLPYLIGGLALTRSICEALDSHHELHAALFAVGLSTLGALA